MAANSTRGLTLVVLAAGMGSRYGGIKQIDPVGPSGEALIEYSIYDALRAGFTRVCFVVRADIHDAVAGFFDPKLAGRADVVYAHQELSDVPDGFEVPADRSKPWGPAHAVRAAREVVDGPFVAINADDFYGRASFESVATFLAGVDPAEARYCMVGYRVDRTLSEHGTVSRALCRLDADGMLTHIEEHKEIERAADGRIVSHLPNGTDLELVPDDVVSMNIFGFTPVVFGHFEEEFRTFLAEEGGNPRSELYLPTVQNDLIRTGRATLRVLPNAGTWFGMTYREDKPMVEREIRRMVEAGEYPQSLWG
ncbi:MAG: NTP transferase domain-containing protein [Spirochaetes bacterium]|jgi:NDP-sugar pyrophosphorylase family protein|nr:NTP transferase domain-containing protein [Spirochaetota bacterium]